jgi:hypothetical protein
MPVHVALAAALAEWKLCGWEAMMGRSPTPDDLIVPMPKSARVPPGKMRTKNDSHKRLRADQSCDADECPRCLWHTSSIRLRSRGRTSSRREQRLSNGGHHALCEGVREKAVGRVL